MNEVSEITQIVFLLCHINERYAADAEDCVNWKRREWVITITEGGKTVYGVALEMDNDAFYAECKTVREDLEQMIEECSLPILHLEDAA